MTCEVLLLPTCFTYEETKAQRVPQIRSHEWLSAGPSAQTQAAWILAIIPPCQGGGPAPTRGLWPFPSCPCVVPGQHAVRRNGRLLLMSGEGETRGRWGAGKSPLGGPSVGTGSGLSASLSHSQALCPGRLPGQEREDEVSFIEGLP